MSILTPKISDNLFFSHQPSFVCLLSVSTLRYLIYTNYDSFLDEKPLSQNKKFLHVTFFKHSVLSRTSHNTTSPNIGGRILDGYHPPSSPKSPPMFLL